MGDGIELLVVFWKAWGIQTLVLLSFALQVTLLITADIRWHKESSVLKAIIWSAYVLADTTAVYALGHLSVTSRSAEHELMAFWASLLLVHLGGQDNITAFAIEDNRLWLRHLQIFCVQVLAAAYVLYESSILRRPTLLLPAAILMFAVGILKYGERVWALVCANNCTSSSLSATSYKDLRHVQQQHDTLSESPKSRRDTEGLLFRAYMMLDVPKQMFEGPTRYVKIDNAPAYLYDEEEISQVVGMQLSMMYDLLYTKAPVVHTWCGWCIRVISLLATVTALLLFHASRSSDKLHGGYSRVDVGATYALLAGAVFLEITSVLRTIFSTWTCVMLLGRGWRRLGRALQFLPRCIRSAVHARYWSGSMGQHNLFHLCRRSRDNPSSKIARWMGREDLWDSMFYSWSISVPEDIINMVVELVSSSEVREDSPYHINNSRGRQTLRRLGMYEHLHWTVDLDLDESILVWHIATHVYLSKYKEKRKDQNRWIQESTKASEALSNYMFLLLAACPYMLPYPVSRQRYVQLCYDVVTARKDLLGLIQDNVNARSSNQHRFEFETINPSGSYINSILSRGCQLAAKLIWRGDGAIFMICDVWVEMLCYTAYRCNENSHAKHLSNGGDIMTAVALAMLYMSSDAVRKRERPPPGPHEGRPAPQV